MRKEIVTAESLETRVESLFPAIQHAKKRAFLAAYAKCGTVTHAAEAAGIDRSSHTHWMHSDPEYVQAFELAKQMAIESLEAEARRRATLGVDDPVFYQGEVVGHRKVYSDNLLMFLLKGAAPAKYRERAEITGAGGRPIRVELSIPRPAEELEQDG